MNNELNIKYYSWKDIERIILLNKNDWKTTISNIDVYPDEIVVHAKKKNSEVAKQLMSELFPQINGETFPLDIGNRVLSITYDYEDIESDDEIFRPLFRNMLYYASLPQVKKEVSSLKGSNILAFHSYKGGVGRTLSVIAFAKAWAEIHPKDKLLIVDADIEAPGLSWLNENEQGKFSYLDLLEIIQSYRNLDEAATIIASEVRNNYIEITVEESVKQYFFMPTYRYLEQLLDMYSTPMRIAEGNPNKFAITDMLSLLGEKLGVSTVLIDLRAGISEFSAPLLFDERVKKYIVTSTSKQSIQGTSILLDQIMKNIILSEESVSPVILMTMVTDEQKTIDLKSELLSHFGNSSLDDDSLLDNAILELPFASELVPLGGLDDILVRLNGRDFYFRIRQLIKDTYTQQPTIGRTKQGSREDIIKKIHEIAHNQISAESNIDFSLLMTKPINNLLNRYVQDVPQTIIMGAKGSGKTFLYRELLKDSYWEDFQNHNQKREVKLSSKTLIVPFISTKNSLNIQSLINQSLDLFSRLNNNSIPQTFCITNSDKVLDFMEKQHDLSEWKEFWLSLFTPNNFKDLAAYNKYLEKNNARVLFLVDGLEEILVNTYSDQSQKNAIKALCQDFISYINIRCKQIGCIVFLRKDMAKYSIMVNFTQFSSVYGDYELSWSHTEALRLVLWLVNQADSKFYGSEKTKIEEASNSLIEEKLFRLWGKKLGKATSNEAYSSRWILAALSDFHGQLQARDIIRFLEYSTETVGRKIYSDRYLMPSEIRSAVPSCSKDKIDEIKTEMTNLLPILTTQPM